ncbi:MAG: putative zinc-binding metallopeptidase [Bryobacteraceae bacterium]
MSAGLRTLPRLYACRCGGPTFFRNDTCLQCLTPLGYEPLSGRVYPLLPGSAPNSWTIIDGPEGLFRRCNNSASPAACNWLVPEDDYANAQPFCASCRLNRTIPDLSIPLNAVYWRSIELAKRRLVSALLALGLPVKSRLTEDPQFGLAFDILKPREDGVPVLTGHSDGIITLNIDEADDATREGIRALMREPYRTVLGHLRHEVGHYYWHRLVERTAWLERFRELFGDEREDYGQALSRYYREGPPSDWQTRHVSAYASAHPWEDWAETWAHFLHVFDTLGTVFSFSLDINSVEMPFEAFGPDVLFQEDDGFLTHLNTWLRFTAVLNEFSRSMGLPDFYPFVLSRSSVKKLHFVHALVVSTGSPRTESALMPSTSSMALVEE